LKAAILPGEDFVRCQNCLLPVCVLLAAAFGGNQSKSRKLMVDGPVCVGGCESWKDSEEGRVRYADLARRYHEYKQAEVTQ
jgi:hypothetical protein